MRSRLSLVPLALAVFTQSAFALSFKAQIQPLRLPLVVSTSQPPKVKYTPPGQIDVGLMRMCGDGDVAHFSKENPDFEFVPSKVKEMDVLIGYWVVPEGGSVLPTASNFYTVGYRKSPIAENQGSVEYNGTFLPLNHAPMSSSEGINGLALLATDVINLGRLANLSFGASKGQQIFAGIFSCLDPSEASELARPNAPEYKFAPSPVEITHSLSSPFLLLKAAEDKVLGADLSSISTFIESNSKIKVALSSDPSKDTIYAASNYTPTGHAPYQFTIGSGGDITANLKSGRANNLINLFEKVAKLTYPELTQTDEAQRLSEYKTKMAAQGVAGQLSGITGNKMGYCSSLGIAVKKDAPQYKWEAFPMNLTCKYLFKDVELVNLYDQLMRPNFLPDSASFENLKRDLAKRFFVAAAYEGVQETMQSESKVKVTRSSCFNSSKKLIGRLVASYPINFQYTADEAKKEYKYVIKPNANNHIHPESLFALVDYKRYYATDALGVWGQVLKKDEADNLNTDKWSIKLPIHKKDELQKHPVDSGTFNGSSINIFFKIRSIGGSCPMYC